MNASYDNNPQTNGEMCFLFHSDIAHEFYSKWPTYREIFVSNSFTIFVLQISLVENSLKSTNHI